MCLEICWLVYQDLFSSMIPRCITSEIPQNGGYSVTEAESESPINNYNNHHPGLDPMLSCAWQTRPQHAATRPFWRVDKSKSQMSRALEQSVWVYEMSWWSLRESDSSATPAPRLLTLVTSKKCVCCWHWDVWGNHRWFAALSAKQNSTRYCTHESLWIGGKSYGILLCIDILTWWILCASSHCHGNPGSETSFEVIHFFLSFTSWEWSDS